MRVIPAQSHKGTTTVYIEVGTQPEIEILDSKMGGGTAASAKEIIDRFSDVGDAISNVCGSVYSRVEAALRDGKAIPNELTIEFAIKLGGKAGIPLVTEGSAEGSFKVEAKWTR